MRPETTITLNKPSFRADEPITGFVDIDIKQSVPGEWDPKLWVVKVRLVGYAQMDTQWHGQARNSNYQEKTRFETLPIEDCQVTVRSTDVPVFVKPGVSNRVRSIPFTLQLSPAQLIASYNAQKGLFLVDYLLTATTRRKCPTSGWPLLKLESRTFVTITPPDAGIEKPLQVTPYSPPLDDMDLFRCPFMQTIRFNYSNQLTPSTLPGCHRMSLYFPRPLYEPEEISLSLTSTLCLQYNHVVNRHVESTDLNFETYYHPDTGGEEVLVEFDIPIKVPQTMDFKFTKGTMTMSHCLRVTMHAKLFPGDRNKTSKKTWSVDLPVTIKGRHYANPPPSPLSALTSPALSALSTGTLRPEDRTDAGRRGSNKTSDTSGGSWIKDRFEMSGDDSDDEGTMPTSAVSATSSFATTTGYSENDNADTTSLESGSPRRSMASPPAKRPRQLKVVNSDVDPPQKPAPTGPLPVPPESKSPSPVLQYRLSPEKLMRPTTGERSAKKRSPDKFVDTEGRKAHRGRNRSRSESQTRGRSVPAKEKPENTFYDPFLLPASSKELVTSAPEETPIPLSASSISTKSTIPQTPTAPAEMPSYYHAKPSYYLDNQPQKSASRPRANTTGSSTHAPTTPTSPGSTVTSPPGSPQNTRVKFNPEISTSPSPPPMYTVPKSPPMPQPKSPKRKSAEAVSPTQPRSPAINTSEEAYPFPNMSAPPRKNSATPSGKLQRVTSPPPLKVTTASASQTLSLSSPLSPPITLAPPVLPPPLDPVPSLAQQVKLVLSPAKLSPPLPSPGLLSPSKPNSSIPRIKTARSSPPPNISTASISSRTRTPIAPRIPPSPSRVARPPLPSHAKERIISMATTDTNTTTRSTVTNAPTLSTAATSQSKTSNTTTPRVQLKRRPTNPSLFPPLPPATLAVQKEQVRMQQQQASSMGEYRGRKFEVKQEERRDWERMGTQDNRTWI